MVLKKFLLEPDNINGNIATIVARNRGFFAWLFTYLFKISAETSLLVTTKDICFKYKSITTDENALMTLRKGIAHIYCRYKKPVWLLVLSIVVFFACIIGFIYFRLAFLVLIVGIIVSAILFIVFYFKKSIEIVIKTCGKTKYGIKFKPSLIEGQDVNLEKAREVVRVIQNQIIKEQA